jgi:hypothetical protein
VLTDWYVVALGLLCVQYLRYKADNGQSCVTGDILKSISLFTLIISLVLLVMYGTATVSYTRSHTYTDIRSHPHTYVPTFARTLFPLSNIAVVQDILLCVQTGHVDVQPCFTVDGVYG